MYLFRIYLILDEIPHWKSKRFFKDPPIISPFPKGISESAAPARNRHSGFCSWTWARIILAADKLKSTSMTTAWTGSPPYMASSRSLRLLITPPCYIETPISDQTGGDFWLLTSSANWKPASVSTFLKELVARQYIIPVKLIDFKWSQMVWAGWTIWS